MDFLDTNITTYESHNGINTLLDTKKGSKPTNHHHLDEKRNIHCNSMKSFSTTTKRETGTASTMTLSTTTNGKVKSATDVTTTAVVKYDHGESNRKGSKEKPDSMFSAYASSSAIVTDASDGGVTIVSISDCDTTVTSRATTASSRSRSRSSTPSSSSSSSSSLPLPPSLQPYPKNTTLSNSTVVSNQSTFKPNKKLKPRFKSSPTYYSTEASSSPSPSYSSPSQQRPILVGYAFGPKKMKSMSVVMAEASMAVSTVVTHIPPRVEKLRSKRKISSSQSHSYLEETCASSSSCTEDNIILFSKSSSNPNKRSKRPPPHDSTAIESNTPTDEEDGDDSCSINTCIEVDSMISMSCATTASTAYETSSSSNTVSCIFPKSTSSVMSCTTNFTNHNNDTNNNNNDINNNNNTPFSGTYIQIPQHYQRMRVCFVPLDLNSPLEEQHGGKFDAILHKMTEDILWKSQLTETSLRYVEEYLLSSTSSPESSSSSSSSSSLSLSTLSSTTTTTATTPPPTTPYASELEKSEEEAMKRIQRLLKYKHDHPACCLVDHPTNVEAVMNRSKIAMILTQCLRGVVTKSGISVRTPRYLVIDDDGDNSNDNDNQERRTQVISKQIDDAPFTYPFMIKPLTAAGTAESHRMGILLGRKGIPKILHHRPCLLQEYTNHDGLLYKVYVLGNRVWVFPRPSLPNLPMGEKKDDDTHGNDDGDRDDNGAHYVDFDSQRPYPKISDFGVVPSDDIQKDGKDSSSTSSSLSSSNDDNMTSDEIRPIADCIRHAFGLELFGFDVLVTTKDQSKKEMFVVDVNYFPSYKEVTNFSELLAQYLAQCGIEGRVRSFEAER